MAKGAYIGVNNVARKIKKGYIGVDGVARKIKKAYIGIGGVARPCWSGGELAYYGTVTSMSYSHDRHAATTAGDYALIGGGSPSGRVEAYSSSLTKSSAESLGVDLSSSTRESLSAASVGGYAFFAGGMDEGKVDYGYYCTANIECYNPSLTKVGYKTIHAYVANLAGASVGNYVIFAGGEVVEVVDDGESTWPTNKVSAFNSSFTKSSPTTLSNAACFHAGASVGNYALFGGGHNMSYGTITNMNAYNASLTRSAPTALAKSRAQLRATAVGNYALFGGGFSSDNSTRTFVDAYNASLTRTTATAFSIARYDSYAATTLGNYALFSGGSDGPKSVDVYDASLTHTLRSELTYNRSYHAAVAIGNYALISGGGGSTKTVEAYTIA